MLRHVCVARRTLAGELALILVVVVLEEVFVYVVHYVEFVVAHGAHEQFLIVSGGGGEIRGRRAR